MLRAVLLLLVVSTVAAATEDLDEAPLNRPPIATIGFPHTTGLTFAERFRLTANHDSSAAPLRVELTAPSRSPSPIRGLLRPTSFELTQTQSTLKGVRAGATAAMFLGAVSNTYGFWDTKKNWWLVGGAAALGGLYGGTLGHDNVSWRVETRLTDEP